MGRDATGTRVGCDRQLRPQLQAAPGNWTQPDSTRNMLALMGVCVCECVCVRVCVCEGVCECVCVFFLGGNPCLVGF